MSSAFDFEARLKVNRVKHESFLSCEVSVKAVDDLINLEIDSSNSVLLPLILNKLTIVYVVNVEIDVIASDRL